MNFVSLEEYLTRYKCYALVMKGRSQAIPSTMLKGPVPKGLPRFGVGFAGARCNKIFGVPDLARFHWPSVANPKRPRAKHCMEN